MPSILSIIIIKMEIHSLNDFDTLPNKTPPPTKFLKVLFLFALYSAALNYLTPWTLKSHIKFGWVHICGLLRLILDLCYFPKQKYN